MLLTTDGFQQEYFPTGAQAAEVGLHCTKWTVAQRIDITTKIPLSINSQTVAGRDGDRIRIILMVMAIFGSTELKTPKGMEIVCHSTALNVSPIVR